MGKRRSDMYEWTDEGTGKEYYCPRVFMKMVEHVKHGKENTVFADAMLPLLGMPVTKANARHLRHAAMILRLQGVLIISVRSKKLGGYFLATPDNAKEVESYCSTEEKIGRSMIAKAANIRKKFAEMVRKNNDKDSGDDNGQQDLFPKK